MASRTNFSSIDTEVSQTSIRTTRSRASLTNTVNLRVGAPSTRRTLLPQLHQAVSHQTTITNGTHNRSTRLTSPRASTRRSSNISTSVPNNTTNTTTRRGSSLAVRTSSYRLRQSTIVDTQHKKKAIPVQPTSVGCKVSQSTPPKLNTRCSLNMINVYYCPICFTNVRKQDGISLIGTNCGHLFCEDCILQAIEKRPKCPLCLKSLTKDQLREYYL